MNYRQKTYVITSQIPRGKVLTYKELANLAQIPSPRLVGLYLHQNPYQKIPCYKVINSRGQVAQTYAFGGGDSQIKKLEKDGIIFNKNDKVDLNKYLWRPNFTEVKNIQNILNQDFDKYIKKYS